MDTKTLLVGLASFFAGGLLVSIAATTFDKPEVNSLNGMASMTQMVVSLRDKKGDNYDKAFIQEMIGHHESAVDMAELSAKNAKHNEIKQLSQEIIKAQTIEITQMKQWQKDWGYQAGAAGHGQTSH